MVIGFAFILLGVYYTPALQCAGRSPFKMTKAALAERSSPESSVL